MQEFVSESHQIDGICGKCGVKEKKGCCKTEIKVVKVDHSQKSDLLTVDFLNQISEAPVAYYFAYADRSFSASKFTQIQINAPPEYKPVPIYINHCNFRI
ncbi:hypothetical protein DRF67_16425 [Chryseobacterium pennipullorum]|uniref:Uncharacterized protein n=2 Tax=Chryseobacterium pennipullorum TaxID=2258963 RepID=A0A3D9AW15_9FLAO|nr:hypothetical protein DRF67_16425 [Chryseobacterium pennipullorum]